MRNGIFNTISMFMLANKKVEKIELFLAFSKVIHQS